ncbi:MAG: SDR family NAD(P)-dependent oxidoreductase [Bacteroidetes bacterium]|nr:SDR family NAD(P)-dependent oxidoreductase [Bacteroidota bacterium]
MSHGRFDNPVVAAMAGFWDLFRKQEFSDRLTGSDRFDGKTCLVTGANSGLGFALAVEMARRGARVIMANRRLLKETEKKVRERSGSDTVEARFLDLSKIDTIHDFVDGLVKDGIKPDVSIMNAGVALPKARKTESGQDEMFLVNYLSNVMLCTLLLNEGVISRNNQEKSFKPRIIFISSDSHQGSSYIDYNEFGRFIEHGVSKGIANYSYFKLILNTYATELSRKLNGKQVDVGVNVICPGPVHSNIIKEAPFILRAILGAIFRVIFRSPAKAALPVVYMAISPDYEGRTNEYQHMFKSKKMDPKVYLPEEGEKLWRRSYELWGEIDAGADELDEVN